jgi:aspartyl-tRNA(Asn)/glutamyl-tRNA(Gln) amidotransferase subunit A
VNIMSENQRPQDSASTLCAMPLSAQAALIARREISCRELVRIHLARCERLNPGLNAFITIATERALADAGRADDDLESGKIRGPLHGIPVAHKDIIDCAGIPTTFGAAPCHHFTPTADADVVANLAAGGAVVIGKCNLDEFAVSATGNNPWHGAIDNPVVNGRSPSGSSGGSAVAVAAGLCGAATGTDTGGSIRNPAAWTGIVGLKPTRGRLSMRGVHPLSTTLDVVGPLARNVHDVELVFSAMRPATAPSKDGTSPARARSPAPAGPGALRLAICPELYFGALDVAVENALSRACSVFTHAGIEVRTTAFPEFAALAEACDRVYAFEMALTHMAGMDAGHDYGDVMRERFAKARRTTRDEYERSLEARQSLEASMRVAMQDVDALLLPISPSGSAPDHDGMCTINGLPTAYGGAGLAMRMWVNLLGWPALAIPISREIGCPIGLQLVGRPFAEAVLFELGRRFEDALC